MKIQIYAVLKDYFDKEFDTNSFESIEQLKNFLSAKNPQAASVLNACRFAVGDEFVDNNYQLSPNDTVSIIPPSSGG